MGSMRIQPRLLRRSCLFFWQRLTRGWDDSDTWNLDSTLGAFLLPRFRRYRALPHGFWHDTALETEQVLAELEWYLETLVSQDYSVEDSERFHRAGVLFGENLPHLWS